MPSPGEEEGRKGGREEGMEGGRKGREGEGGMEECEE